MNYWLLVAALALGAGEVSTPSPKVEAHGLIYTQPATVWDEAFPLGNGRLGALVWGDGDPLKISLDHTGLWDLRPVPEFHRAEYSYKTMRNWEKAGKYEDLERLYEAPYNRPGPTKIPAGRIELGITAPGFERAVLDIGAAQANIKLGGGVAASVWVHATEPVGVVTVHGSEGINPKLVAPLFGGKPKTDDTPAISAGELSNLGYPPPVETSGEGWQAYTQEGFSGFRFAVWMGWGQTQDGGWRAAWSIATSHDGPDPLNLAKERASQALGSSIDGLEKSHREWWRQYWRKGWLSLPDPVIERQWYLDMYKFGAASRSGAPPITLQGPWTADDGKLPPWKGDYHHDLNTELSYWPAYTGGRLNEAQNFVDWLWETKENCEGWTKRFFNMPGLNVPMTADLLNNQIGGWRQYTHSATTSAWLSHHFYLHWRYSMDRKFLEERAYPYLAAVVTFLETVTNERDKAGKRTLPLSSSPEMHDNTPEAWFDEITNYDNALIQWAFAKAAELARELGKEEEAKRWEKALGEMPTLAFGDKGQLLVAPGHPLEESHRHLSNFMALHPLGLIDPSQGEQAGEIFAANLGLLDELGTSQWTGYSFAWHAALAARGRDGDKAANSLRIFSDAFCLRNSFHCNGDQSGKGYSDFTYRPFTLEGNFAAAAATMELMLQSQAGYIDIFPAVPKDWKDAAFYFLRAQGAFVVTAEMKDSKVRMAEILALAPGLCRVHMPGAKKLHEQAMARGESLLFDGKAWKLRQP